MRQMRSDHVFGTVNGQMANCYINETPETAKIDDIELFTAGADTRTTSNITWGGAATR